MYKLFCTDLTANDIRIVIDDERQSFVIRNKLKLII